MQYVKQMKTKVQKLVHLQKDVPKIETSQAFFCRFAKEFSGLQKKGTLDLKTYL